MKRTISFTIGEGSLAHNKRDFFAENVDPARTHLNVEYCSEKIENVYHELFDESVERYNARQKRKDRKITSYYDKIRLSKNQKLYYEIIVQIGNRNSCATLSQEGELAAQILDQYMKEFAKRNPTLRVFSAHLHMDEETPHLHIDFIPYIVQKNSRGLDTRVSLKQSLASLGFIGEGREFTEFCQWKEAEENYLATIMREHGIEWEKKGGHEKHLSILNYKKQKRMEEIIELEKALDRIREQNIALNKIEKVEAKPLPLTNKVIIDEKDLELLQLAAKRLLLEEDEKTKLKKELENIRNENEELDSKLNDLSNDYNDVLEQLRSITDLRKRLYTLEIENKKLHKRNLLYESFIKVNNLIQCFRQYSSNEEHVSEMEL